MSKQVKLLAVFSLLLSAVACGLFIKVLRAEAQVPPPIVPCDDSGKDPEFSSQRPYQASPCGTSPKAMFCGDKINITETVTRTRYSNFGPTMETSANIDKTYEVAIDSASLPILGNTELTKNSGNPNDSIDDAEKTNEYLDWYLGGTNNKAEYPPHLSVDFAGPLQKTLPSVFLDAQRINTIKAATKDDPQNHNQIAVCATENSGGWAGRIQDFFGLGATKPVECYPSGNGSSSNGDDYRLSDWKGDLGFFTTLEDAAVTLFKNIPDYLKGLPGIALDKVITPPWNKRTPPLPWADGDGKPFESYLLYQKAYSEWQGKSCIIITSLGKLICVDNPLVPNKYADLYPYIPLANTTDKDAKVVVSGVNISASTGEINGSHTSQVLSEPILYYPHTKENVDLTKALNRTFTPKEGTSKSVDFSTVVSGVGPNCTPVDVRLNSGDNLFPESTIKVRVNFTVTKLACDPANIITTVDPEGTGENIEIGTQECKAVVNISIPTTTETPYANEIWQNTVGGSSSTFRKIFPKVDADAPVSCISDIPGESNTSYSVLAGQSDNTTISTDGSNLFFAHVGGVYEYFLKGIQTALRPKGYGAPISSGSNCTCSKGFGSVCAVASKYNIPCCQLQGVMQTETGSDHTIVGGSCSTKFGTFSCCHGSVCGPAQVACSQYNGFAGNDRIDMCSDEGAAELLARAMLLKLYQADKTAVPQLDSYDWVKYGAYALAHYNIEKICDDNPDQCYTATAYFYGLQNGCYPSACTQFRWGAGKSYCDSVKSYCDSGALLPDATDGSFCSACNEEIVRANQPPIDCSKYNP